MRRLCVLILALASCSTLPPHVGEPTAQVADAQAEQAYREMFDRWTRNTTVFDKLDNRLYLAVTEQTPEFVKARVERLATFKGMPATESQALLTRELTDTANGYNFFFGMQTANRKWNDLDSDHSIWRVALRTGAGEVLPIEVQRIQRPDANLRGLYYFLGDFWVAYRVRFPARLPDGRSLVGAGETQFVVTLDSALGHARLEFPAVQAALAAPVEGAP